MKPLRKNGFLLFLFLSSLVWATDADPRDKEIVKDLDFFQTMEVVEAMPLLTEFGSVLDEIKKENTPITPSAESSP